jgi:acyl-CoA thioesterase
MPEREPAQASASSDTNTEMEIDRDARAHASARAHAATHADAANAANNADAANTANNADAALLLAEQTARAMYSRDAASQLIDLQLLSVRPGYSRLTMRVRPDMVNGHHICHGGYLFTLADSAFAYACNSYNRNTVASACHIDFLSPAREGELLEAESVERSLSGRTGLYDTTIRNQHGKVIALFRGKSYRIAGEVIAGLEAKDSEQGSSTSTADLMAEPVEGNPQ